MEKLQREYRIPITSCGFFNRQRIVCCTNENNVNSLSLATTQTPYTWNIETRPKTTTTKTTTRITTPRTYQRTQPPRSKLRISQQRSFYNPTPSIDIFFNRFLSILECEYYKKHVTMNITLNSLEVSRNNPIVFTVPDCDYVIPLVVGGKKASKFEFPHMVLINIYN